MKEEKKMSKNLDKKYKCEPCEYIYDPRIGDRDGGVAPGVPFADLPENWICPNCGVGKEYFVPVEEDK